MTLLQKVRLFYSAAFFVGISVMYSMFSSLILSSSFTIDVALLAVLFGIISAFFRRKYSNGYLYIIVPLAIVIAAEKLFLPWSIAIVNGVFILIINLIYMARYGNEPDYMMFKDDLRFISIALFMCMLFFTILGGSYNRTVLYRSIIIYITAAVLSLKESMKYSYRVESGKGTDIVNISVIAIMLAMCSTFVSDAAFSAGRAVFNALSYVAGKAVMLLAFVLGPVFEFFYKMIKSRVASSDVDIKIADNSVNKSQNTLNAESNSGDFIGTIIKYIIIAVIIMVIAVVVYKLVKMITHNKKMEEISEDYEENVCTVNDAVKIRSGIRLIPKNNRERIIFAYDKMVRAYRKRGIFKQYMTPSQFGNVMKINNENPDGIDGINSTYSKAKFSKHDVSDSETENATKSINNILKKTGKILKNSKDF